MQTTHHSNTCQCAPHHATLHQQHWLGILFLVFFVFCAGNNINAAGGKEDAMFSAHLMGLNLPAELAALERKGELTKAMAWIDENPAPALTNERERLRRMVLEYNLDEAAMLEKIQKDLPTATLEQLREWTAQGMIMSEPIDGATRYFRREPSNLWRRSTEARTRRDEHSAKAPAQLADPASAARGYRLDNVTAAVAGTTEPVRFKVQHTLTVPADKIPAGETVQCWLPIPKEYGTQSGPQKLVANPAAKHTAHNDAPQRTVYMEQVAKADEPTTFVLNYEYTMSAFHVPNLDADKVKLDPADPIVVRYTQDERPHIIVDDETRKLAHEIVGDEKNPLKQAAAIWHWMQDKIAYEAEMNYGVLPSCTAKIHATRAGDCGIQALLYISLCRSLGIPARWQSGWVTTPGRWNMHDWAEIYMPPFGWLPVDPSVGYMKSDTPAIKHFLFGGLDAYRMIANLQSAAAFTPAETHLRSDPVDSQVGEVQWRGGNLYNTEWTYEVTVESGE